MRQLLAKELLAKSRGFGVTNLPRERDRLGDDMSRRQRVIGQPHVPERLKNFHDTSMVSISFRDQREQEAGIQEDQASGRP